MNTREKIMEVAGRLFAEHGFDGVSVRDIIEKAGVNLGAVTYHFSSKEALFAEIVGQKIMLLKDAGEEMLKSRKTPEDKLRALLEVQASQILHEDPGLKVLFAESLAGGRRLPKEAVDAMSWGNRMFAEIVREGVKKGVFRKCDVECAAWSFFGMLSAYMLYQPLINKVAGGGKYPRRYVKRAVDAAMDIFLDGLKTSARRGVKRKAGRL
jgi:AcrR family transcriptional regulator